MNQALTPEQTKLYENIVGKLKSKNIKLTQVRVAVIKILLRLDHPTASMIVDELKKDHDLINVASVYNTLNVLLTNHVVSANTFNGKQICYEIIEPNTIHFACIECNQLYHASAGSFENQAYQELEKLAQSIGFVMDHYKIEGHGICHNCLAKQQKKGTKFA